MEEGKTIKLTVSRDQNTHERILHQHLRYAGLVEISEFMPEHNEEPIVLTIQLPPTTDAERAATRFVERVNSFAVDKAEIIEKCELCGWTGSSLKQHNGRKLCLQCYEGEVNNPEHALPPKERSR